MGTTCEQFLKNQTVFIPLHTTMEILEDNLKAAYYGVIKESKDMNPNCRGFALPSLCFSVLPICRTPEETNHQFFRNKAIAMEAFRKKYDEHTTPADVDVNVESKSTTSVMENNRETREKEVGIDQTLKEQSLRLSTSTSASISVSATTESYKSTHIVPTEINHNHNEHDVRQKRSVDGNPSKKNLKPVTRGREAFQLPLSETEAFKKHYPPTRKTENLRRICRNECELLENELCQKEYAIAKRHPAIGQVLPLEDCHDLPEGESDCSTLGIAIDVDETERCFWENGAGYRGTVAISQSGKPCLTWARLMKEIADYPELAGLNYCR